MPFFKKAFLFAKEHNIIFGIIFTDLIAFIAYIMSYGFSITIFDGDIHMIVGVTIGVYFTMRYLEKDRSPLTYGIIIGFFGTLLTAITLTLFQWTYNWFFIGTIDFQLLILYLIPGFLIGPIIGLIIGLIFRYKGKKEKSLANDDFYENLKEEV